MTPFTHTPSPTPLPYPGRLLEVILFKLVCFELKRAEAILLFRLLKSKCLGGLNTFLKRKIKYIAI